MKLADIEFRAEANGKKLKYLKEEDLVKEGDFFRWTSTAFTTIDAGSEFIGQSKSKISPNAPVLRIVKATPWKRPGTMVLNPWGQRSKLHRIGNGGLAIKEFLPCVVCLKNDIEVCLVPGGPGGYCYIVDEKTGKYLANIRDQVYVCPDKKCQEDYHGKPKPKKTRSKKK
jgi:hypothetical protein